MKGIKFQLSGKTAFFKKPDVNQNYYFTYSQIHKLSIIGILGAILGLDGYSKQYIDKNDYPDFYNKLKFLKIAIVPQSENQGYFNKKIVSYNNTTGFASKEEGGNLVVNEQWLIDVKWDIYIYDDGSDIYNLIQEYLINKKCIYIPYLGRTDHYADINNVEIVNFEKQVNPKFIHSLYMVDNDIKLNDDSIPYDNDAPYRYSEYLPYKLDSNNMYEYELFSFTNLGIKILEDKKYEILTCNNKNLMFI